MDVSKSKSPQGTVNRAAKQKVMPSAVGITHYAPLGAAGIVAPMGPFCKPHVQRGVLIWRQGTDLFYRGRGDN